jgi:hypothetical protein
LAPERAVPAVRRFSYPSLRASLVAWLSSPDFRVPFSIWTLTRLLFLLLTYFGVVLFNSVLHGPHPSFVHSLLPAWQNPISHGGWDTQWYINIAQKGYDWKNPAGTTPAAFFPLYPLLIRAVVEITHRSWLIAALTVSNLSFLGALLYLWRLTAWEFDAAVARRTVLYIAVFPTALFFFAGYSESLFLFLTVGAVFHLRRKQWLAAGCFAALASATRVTGVLLILPFAYEYARAHNFELRRMVAPRLIGLLLVPAGLVAFMVYLKVSVGDPIAFSHGQAAWQKILTLKLWAGFEESARQIMSVQPQASFYQAHNLINVVIGGTFLLATVLAARRLPASYTAYSVGFWLVTLSSPATAGGYPVPLISLSRYVLTLFPIFMYFGLLGRERVLHDGYLVLCTAMLSLFTVQFLIGGWII